MAPLLELEGTWQQIQSRVPEFSGKKLRVVIFSAEDREVKDEQPLADVLAELVGSIPVEEQASLPSDFADQVDHYVYGVPKR